MADVEAIISKAITSLNDGSTLIRETHLKRYDYLKENLLTKSVSDDLEFQRKFVGLYKVRFLPNKKEYFQIMEREKTKLSHDFRGLLSEMYSVTGRFDVSFISKLISIINPSCPVWDSILVSRLKIKPSGNDLNAKVSDFNLLSQRMQDILIHGRFSALMEAFEVRFGKRGYVPMRVLDVSIWGLGKDV